MRSICLAFCLRWPLCNSRLPEQGDYSLKTMLLVVAYTDWDATFLEH